MLRTENPPAAEAATPLDRGAGGQSANPLLDFSDLPRFAAVGPEHIAPAVDRLVAENRALVARLTASDAPPTWSGFVQPLEDANERLSRAWGVVSHLHGVLDSPELRDAYKASQPKIVQYWTELGQNQGLFAKYEALQAAPEHARLGRARQKVIANELRDFRLSGAELEPEAKRRFAAIQEELAKVATKFSENLLDATNAYAIHVEEGAALAGIPDDVLETARAAAEKDGRRGWKLVLHAPCFVPVMQYAEHRGLREIVYRGFVTRASEEFAAAFAAKAAFEAEVNGRPAPEPPSGGELAGWDNTPLITRILALRREAAGLLGYASPAQVSLVPKMAQSPRQVLEFLNDLAAKARPYAKRDWAELTAFAAGELGLPAVAAWDVAFASEKLRQARYAFSDQEVKQYFPEPKVLAGMFRVVETLYGLRIADDRAETWDPAVRFFRITDASGELVGRFYLDPYARDTKRGGAWMDEAVTRRRAGERVQAPVAYLVCNFPAPVGGKPALLTHDDVLTLFHEFGHGLHSMLTRARFAQFAGTNVPRDFVEAPSQMLENWVWDAAVLNGFAADYRDPAKKIDPGILDKMKEAKLATSGTFYGRQVALALSDLRLHAARTGDAAKDARAILNRAYGDVFIELPAGGHLGAYWGHLTGYDAGYYGYLWSEAIAADMASVFETAPGRFLDAGVGRRLRDEIYAVGGSREAEESIQHFLLRERSNEPFLKSVGLK